MALHSKLCWRPENGNHSKHDWGHRLERISWILIKNYFNPRARFVVRTYFTHTWCAWVKKLPCVSLEKRQFVILFNSESEAVDHGDFKDWNFKDNRQPEIAVWPSKPEVLISESATDSIQRQIQDFFADDELDESLAKWFQQRERQHEIAVYAPKTYILPFLVIVRCRYHSGTLLRYRRDPWHVCHWYFDDLSILSEPSGFGSHIVISRCPSMSRLFVGTFFEFVVVENFAFIARITINTYFGSIRLNEWAWA